MKTKYETQSSKLKMAKCFYALLLVFYSLFLSSCHGDYSPKPKAYPRVIFPEQKYDLYNPVNCPFKFEKPVYALVQRDSTYMNRELSADLCWLNVYLNPLNGVINLTYKDIENPKQLEQLIEDAHKLAFKHTKKANYIDEVRIENPHGAGGILYDLGGDAASNVQFFLTDSNKHFVRGALYFYNQPNADSMEPVLNFVKTDIEHLLKTFEWK